MGSLSGPTLDEAHCLWPLCSHTSCWEAEQRIRAGRPRKVKALTHCRASVTASEEDRFPAITIVNASEWPDAGAPNELCPLLTEDDFSEAATNTLTSWVALPRGMRKQENVQIPTSSLAGPTHLETQRESKPVKLRTVHISPLPSYTSTSQSSKPIVMWVSSSCNLPLHDSQHSAKSPRLAVKELIFLPSVEMNRSVEKKKKLKQDKSRRRTLLKLTPLKSQLKQEGKGSLKSDLQVKKASAPPQVHHLAAAPEGKEDQQPPRSAQTIHLRKKPVWEMMQRRHTQEEHRTSKYKLDQETGMDGIDWESLKRQTYLWRRPSQPVRPECERPSPSNDRADYVPYSLHPVSIQS